MFCPRNATAVFYGTDLATLLAGTGVNSVRVAGVCTSICVMDTVGGLANRDYRITVSKQEVADFDPEMHEFSLKRMKKYLRGRGPMIPFEHIGPLFTDLYELTMAAGYFDHGMTEEATFSMFIRPGGVKQRPFYVAAGLEDVLRALEQYRFSATDIAYLESTGMFSGDFLACLSKFRFSGDVAAMPEGTVFFRERADSRSDGAGHGSPTPRVFHPEYHRFPDHDRHQGCQMCPGRTGGAR